MSSTIPRPAHDLVHTITEAVDTATSAHDAATFERTTADLATKPIGGRVLGDVLRSLLEDTHPDGFSSEDITLVVGRCYRAAATWLPPERIDVTTLLTVLASALGIDETTITDDTRDHLAGDTEQGNDSDDAVAAKPLAWPDYAWHAPLLLADLLPFAPATLSNYIETTFTEYAREAREELP
jgi:hypothetical protein